MLLQEDAAETGNDSAIADLERIQSAGRNLLTVINDILDLARLDSGKAAIERGVIDVREMPRPWWRAARRTSATATGSR